MPSMETFTTTHRPMETDPSVIVGMACRVPGANNPSQLWDVIAEQKDLRRKIPEDRFNVDNFYHPDGTNKGTTNTRYGYFLNQDIGKFDASFFGISGKEAEAMDPQQRLLLEVVYEALEDAGIPIGKIDGSFTAVLCGCFTNDYNAMLSKDLESYPKYTVTGTGNSILANRISYFFNLHGMSLTIDTACSSSLVCFHLANKLLLDDEAEMSIVVGSSLHFDPSMFITMTDLGMLSPDGRSKAFDASADGYARGEGICAVVLKRQRAAEDSGDTIRAIVRATGSNHDGRKQGITLPNPAAQEKLIRETYQSAGLHPIDTQYFECHGTGTKAGDPIETRAVGAVFSPDRDEPLRIGSLKSNIGHLEGASGLASIIKTTMSLERGQILPNMHFNVCNPEIDLAGWKLEVPTQLMEWPKPANGIRRASVNSFGYGGANAHVVLEQYCNVPTVSTNYASKTDRQLFLLPLTSHSDKASTLWEQSLANYLAERKVDISNLAFTLSHRRTMNSLRSFVVADSAEVVQADLQQPRTYAPWTLANGKKPRLGFVFTGQGAQWHAMGRELIHGSAAFRQTLERCDYVLQLLPDSPSWSILQELTRDEELCRLHETLFSQTICTAVQLALLQLLSTWGITPSAVVGHSSGEVAAAHAAGILSFENAIVTAYYRGKYMSSDSTNQVPGAMLAVGLSESEAVERLKAFSGRLALAAVNSPSSMTISGDEDAILELKKVLDDEKTFNRRLKVKQAFHSHHMAPLASAYESALRSHEAFTTQPAKCRMFSTVTARLADHTEMGPKYWAANMTQTVRFSDGLTGILLDEYDQQNIDALVEIGPHPALKSPCRQVAQSLKMELPYFGTLARGNSDVRALLTTAGQLFSVGYPVDLVAVNRSPLIDGNGVVASHSMGKKLPDFPSYQWDHSSRYWSETRVIREHRLRRYRHSLLGHIIPGTVADQPQWRNIIRISELPWLSDHAIEGKVVFPAAGYLTMAIEAILRQQLEDAENVTLSLKDVVFKAPLIIPEGENGVEVLLALYPAAEKDDASSTSRYDFAVYSYGHNHACTNHCWGQISATEACVTQDSELFEATPRELQKLTNYSVSSAAFYRRLNSIGLHYGNTFKLLANVVESGNRLAMGRLSYDPSILPSSKAERTVIHPTFLDASFHTVFSAIESYLGKTLESPYVPSSIKSMSITGFPTVPSVSSTEQYNVYAKATSVSLKSATSSLLIQNEGTQARIEISGLELVSLSREDFDLKERELFFQQLWLPCYDMLHSSSSLCENSVKELVEIFAHQYPNSRILYVTDNMNHVTDVALQLGGGKHAQRRIQSIDVHITGHEEKSTKGLEEAIEDSNAMLRFEISDGKYDLVVVNTPDCLNQPTLLSVVNASDNLILTEAATNIQVTLQQGLVKNFTAGSLTAYSRKATTGHLAPYTVVLPDKPSDRIKGIYNELGKLVPMIITKNIEQLENRDMNSPETLVVLATLDGSLDNQAAFLRCQRLLSDVKSKMVWIVEGATMNSPQPKQAIVLGLLRAACSENEQLSIQVLDIDPDSTSEGVAKTIYEVQKSALQEDEITERGGRIYLPRIQADDARNKKLSLKRQNPALALFDSSKTYLLVGGLGGIGRTLSQWMIRRGAKQLAFLSRSGIDKRAAKTTIQWLSERDIDIQIFHGDVANMEDVQNCISAIGSNLGGVFHAAMVINDSMLDAMTFPQWQETLEPKVQGAQNLHDATSHMDLECFVCFSSTTSVIGVKGLANYCAANLFLDALMRHRREMKLCGTTMNVGALLDVGVLAENNDLQKSMERLKMDFISEEELFLQLEDAVLSGRTEATARKSGVDDHQTITGINVKSPDVYWASKSLFRNLYHNRKYGAEKDMGPGTSLHAALSNEVDPIVREDILLDAFLEHISVAMCLKRENLLPDKPLSSYGLDSLVATDVRKWFRIQLYIDVPLFDILTAQPIRDLVHRATKLMNIESRTEDDAESMPNANSMNAANDSTARISTLDGIRNRSEDQRAIPLSSYQSRLWYLHNMLEDKSSLNLSIVMHISGTPDQTRLQQALAEVTRRNETFRTAYLEGADFVQQLPIEKYNLKLLWEDYSGAKQPKLSLHQLVEKSQSAPLDISSGQMATWCLVKLGQERLALVATIHHLAVDRGSHKSVLSQLVHLYNALGSGSNHSTVPAPSLTYADFTLWHNGYLQSTEVYRHREWWKTYLAQAPSACRLLPFARVKQRPKRSNPSRAFVKTHLDDRLLKRMKRIASQHDATAHHFLLAAFRAFLYRYTEDEDLIMLIADGTRPHPDIDDIVGFFVNMCPVRCNSDCETGFEELLYATKAQALEVMKHNSVPFDAIVDAVRAPRSSAHAPLAQVAINYQIHGAVAKYQAEDFVIEEVSMTDIPTMCELSLEALETNDQRLGLRLEYSTELYGSNDMERFVENFATFLSSIIKDHRQPIEEVELCGRQELKELRQNYWNMQTTQPLWDEPVIDRILRQGRKSLHKVAVVVSSGESITYEKLFENASTVAARLQAAGVSSGDRVAIITRPGVDTITGMLATLMVRGCFVALDLNFAHDRLSLILKDTGSKAVYVGVGAETIAKSLIQNSSIPIQVFYAREKTIQQGDQGVFSPNRTRMPSNPFYMIYTSGSTGVPKGVVISESNVHQMLGSLQEKFAFSSGDRFLHQSSVSFDTSIAQIFPALCSGATLCIASSQTRRDPAALADFMAEQSVTVTYFTPTHFSLLLESNIEALRQCREHRIALFNGEVLPPRVVKAVYDLQTPAVVFNGWCPSEVTVQTTIARVPYPNETVNLIPIGYPLDNCRHYILDKRGNPLPAGLLGEIAVGGAQVGQGYLHRARETEKSFVQDPFCSEHDRSHGWTRMFKTGDRGRFLPDGQLEFHGRIQGDKQLKLRGFRIDLGEIEHCIFEACQNNHIRALDVILVTRMSEHSAEDARIVCFLHLANKIDKDQSGFVAAAIHHSISSCLNHYMLPDAYCYLDQVPMTASGKVDRLELQRRDFDLVLPSSALHSQDELRGRYETPQSLDKMEASVLEIFQSILGTATQFSDNFFEKGGNSLSLVRLQTQIRKAFNIAPKLLDLFQDPTASAVSSFLRSCTEESNHDDHMQTDVDWVAESTLPIDRCFLLPYRQDILEYGEKAQGILIAGEISKISAHILFQLLLKEQNTRIFLLGLANVPDHARVICKLRECGLFHDAHITECDIRDRVRFVQGSLLEAGFGLSKQAFRRLGGTLRSIYFLGGEVSLLQSYSYLKTSNVDPVLDLIELAGIGGSLSSIHYLSTWSVAHLQSWRATQNASEKISTEEEDMIHFMPPSGNELGYFKARWVAERLLMQAASRGFPVTVTRTSTLSSASNNSNAVQSNQKMEDFTISMVKSMITSRVVPHIGWSTDRACTIDIIPIDYMASAFVALTSNFTKPHEFTKEARIFHLRNPSPLRLEDLPKEISDENTEPATTVPVPQWLDLMDNNERVLDNPSWSITSAVLREYFCERGHVMFSLDSTNTMKALEATAPGLAESCPPVTRKLLDSL